VLVIAVTATPRIMAIKMAIKCMASGLRQNVSVAVIPGDGIGHETVHAARRVMDAITELDGGIRGVPLEL